MADRRTARVGLHGAANWEPWGGAAFSCSPPYRRSQSRLSVSDSRNRPVPGHAAGPAAREGNRHEEAVEFGRHFDIDVHHVQETTLQQIFEPDIRRHTIFLSLAFLTNWIGIQVLPSSGPRAHRGQGSVRERADGSHISNAAAYIGYLCHGYVGDRIGRRLTIAGGWVISGLAYSLMLFGPSSETFVLTMYTIGLFFIIGPYAALLFFMGESFPTRVRGTGPRS